MSHCLLDYSLVGDGLDLARPNGIWPRDARCGLEHVGLAISSK
jgi:hypothetical protein